MALRKIGVVLGAGGPVGHAFHAGVLKGLAAGTGWDPRDADLVVGTSAGAQVGALLRAGMSADDLSARVTGEEMTAEGAEIAQHYTRPSRERDPSEPRRPWRPASPRYLAESLRRPWRARPGRVVSALLPEGHVDLTPQAEGLRRIFGDGWPERPLWITAVCLESGERVAFGHPDAPKTDVGTAVASSGSVPAVCQPVRAVGRQLVDGGIASPTHLDLLEDTDHEVVFVLSPLSMVPPMRLLLWNEVRRLRAAGKRVVVFEPVAEASEAMGYDMMDLERSADVARAAFRTTLRWLGTEQARVILTDVL